MPPDFRQVDADPGALLLRVNPTVTGASGPVLFQKKKLTLPLLWPPRLAGALAPPERSWLRCRIANSMRLSASVFLSILLLLTCRTASAQTNETVGPTGSAIPHERMQAIYDEVKTPFKYGVVLEPPPGKKVDCPNVFRYGDKWYLVYVLFETDPQGYTTQLAESDDLLHWKPLGAILPRGETNTWDQANAGGGVALFDTTWGGSNTLQTYDGRYWLSYLGGAKPGYEKTPLSIGIASTTDPSKPIPWQRLPKPVMRADDPDARWFESETLFKSYILRDPAKTLGAPFVMFYNARPPKNSERIGVAVSQDMQVWKRYGDGPVVANEPPPGAKYGVISGDPQVVRMGDLWVMFYFGAFWKSGAFDTFAASRDLMHWTKWDGPDLIKPSEPWDTPFAHKPWLIKYDGIVYHFYCAVGGKKQHRTIALATSKDLRPADKNEP